MEQVFSDMKFVSLLIYLDDIIVFGQTYVGRSGSSWNLVIKRSNIYIILSFFEISQVDIYELASRS